MSTYERSPGEPLPTLKTGDVLELAPGEYRASVKLSSVRDVTLRGTGAWLVGGSSGNGIRAERVGGLRVEGIGTRGWERGIRTIRCEELAFVDVEAREAGIEGGQFNDTHGLLLERFRAIQNGKVSNRGHGVYIANSSKQITIRDLLAENCGGCGLQFNGDPSMKEVRAFTGFIDEVTLLGAQLLNNRAGAGMNCAGLRGSQLRNVLVTCKSSEAGGIVFFADGPASFASQGIGVDRFTVVVSTEARFGVKLDTGAKGIELANGILSGGREGALVTAGGAKPPSQSNVVQAANEGVLDTLLPGWRGGDYRSARAGMGWAPSGVVPSPEPPPPPPPDEDENGVELLRRELERVREERDLLRRKVEAARAALA